MTTKTYKKYTPLTTNDEALGELKIYLKMVYEHHDVANLSDKECKLLLDELEKVKKMIIKTTKQIREQSNAINVFQEWVCLSDLKKEIENLILEDNWKPYNKRYNDAIRKVLFLCKSSEQSKGLPNAEHSSAESVSGEHNTGEDDKTLCCRKLDSKSSPVHCPEGVVELAENIIEKYDGVLKELSKPNVQKKCTCELPYTQVVLNEYICGRCGGAL